jgi:hypothetical protein
VFCVKKGIKKTSVRKNGSLLLARRPEQLLAGRADDETVTIDSTFDGDTEEGVIPHVFAAGTGKGGAHRTATGDSDDDSSQHEEHQKLFHDILSLFVLLKIPRWDLRLFTYYTTKNRKSKYCFLFFSDFCVFIAF